MFRLLFLCLLEILSDLVVQYGPLVDFGAAVKSLRRETVFAVAKTVFAAAKTVFEVSAAAKTVSAAAKTIFAAAKTVFAVLADAKTVFAAARTVFEVSAAAKTVFAAAKTVMKLRYWPVTISVVLTTAMCHLMLKGPKWQRNEYLMTRWPGLPMVISHS